MDLMKFFYEEEQLSLTVLLHKETKDPWFLLREVCDVLGFPDTGKKAKSLEVDEHSMINIADNAGRLRQMHIISESGLYRLIMRIIR